MLFMDDILDEEDVLMIFDEVEVKKLTFSNLVLMKTTFPQFICRRAAENEFPTCTCHRQLRMQNNTKDMY